MEWQIFAFEASQMAGLLIIYGCLVRGLEIRRDALKVLAVQLAVLMILTLPTALSLALFSNPFEGGLTLFLYAIVSVTIMQIVTMIFVNREYFSVSTWLWFAMFGTVAGGLVWLDGLSFVQDCLARAATLGEGDGRLAAAVACKSDATFFLERIFDGMNFVMPTFAIFIVAAYTVQRVQYAIGPRERSVLVLVSSVALVSVLAGIGVWAANPALNQVEEASNIIARSP